jgi:glycosyltransferase involved in cell wall biosynthesis
MSRSLIEHDVRITVATTDDDGPGKRLAGVQQGVEVNQGCWDAIYFPKQTEFYKTSLPLRRWLRAHVQEFDAVHIHAVFSFASLAAGRAASARGIPYIVRPLGVLNRWGMENRRRFVKALSFRFFDLPMLKKAAAMHYTSRMELEEAARFHLPGIQRVIPIGIDTTPFDSLPHRSLFNAAFPETAGTRNLLFLSRIDLKKGLDLLIAAFAQLLAQHPGTRLVICGGGDTALIDKLKTMARTAGETVSASITWTGAVSGDLRLAAFAAADIFILPSHSENFGIALLEAMAAGLPCLSTDQVALAVDAERQNAVRLTARDPQSIAGALHLLLNSESERQSLAQNASTLARSDYSLAAMGVALHQLYQDVTHRAA